MDSSVSPKDEIWFLRVCHHISNAVYLLCTEAAYVSCMVVWMTTLEASQSQPGAVFCSRCSWPMSTSPKYLVLAKRIT